MEISKISFTLSGQLVDLKSRSIYPAQIEVDHGRIKSISKIDHASDIFLMPGFIDAHIHVESSMLIPSQFARLAVKHGTVATVSDPHEIANVLGLEGIEFMISDGKKTPFKFNFGAPSCVPPTTFETSGASVNSDDVKNLLARKEIKYLAEMMNYPGVLHKDPEVLLKLKYAKEAGLPIDGHAPGLTGNDAISYIGAGISTDHECFTYEEAKFKIDNGMKILIREGSAAKNYNALAPLFNYKPEQLMFCSDDKHPDDFIEGHINKLVERAVTEGYDLFDVLTAACITPIHHYSLDVGSLNIGDPADFILVENLRSFDVVSTYLDGIKVYEDGLCLFDETSSEPINNFHAANISSEELVIPADGQQARIIHALNGEIITKSFVAQINSTDGIAQTNVEEDILKICVVNRYQKAKPSCSFIHGFGLTSGALASCVGHDTHNIIAVGCDDESITEAVNLVIENKGGISAVGHGQALILPLPFGGIMSGDSGEVVGKKYAALDRFTKDVLGSNLSAPYMTLSFMALLVIPDLKLSDLGLFDGNAFKFTSLWVTE